MAGERKTPREKCPNIVPVGTVTKFGTQTGFNGCMLCGIQRFENDVPREEGYNACSLGSMFTVEQCHVYNGVGPGSAIG